MRPDKLWLVSVPFLFILPEVTTLEQMEIGITVTLSLFLGGVYIQRRQIRIDRAVSKYLDLFKSNPTQSGLQRLLECGAVELKNRRELNEVCRRTTAHNKPHPNYYDEVSNGELLAFLKFCHQNGHDVSSGSDTLVVVAQFRKQLP